MGQGAFMAIGAYVSTAMMVHYDWSFPASLVLALVVAALAAVLLGVGALRLAHIGLAIVTFSFAFVVFMLLNGDLLKRWTGQATGMTVPPATLLGLDFTKVSHAFVIALVGLVVTFASTYVYVHSRHGRVLMAIKRSEVLPSVMGVNVFRAKLIAFVWSSVVGAFAGAILAQATGFVTPEAYTANLSVTLLAIAAIGGLGTLAGPAIGAAFYAYVGYVGSGVTGSGMWWPLAFLVVLIFSPAGLYGLFHGATSTVAARLLGRSPVRTHETVAGRSGGGHASHPAPVESPLGDAAVLVAGDAAAEDVAAGEARGVVLGVDDVILKYGGVTALDQVGFAVREGTVHALIGPNGAGKTSLLDVLAGVTAPTSGRVRLDDRDITGLPPYRRTRLGLRRAFQHATLVGDLTIFQNVQLAAENGRSVSSTEAGGEASAADRAAAALHLAGVREATWTHSADELNGGDQKLVDMARAFVGSPRVILLDEPTSGVTEAETGRIVEAVRSAVRAGLTVVVIDHNVEFVKSIADEVTVLDFGRVIAAGDPGTVLEDPVVIRAFLGGDVENAG